MKRFLVALILAILVSSCGVSEATTRQITPKELGLSSLRTLAQNRGISIGTAVDVKPFRKEPLYTSVLAHEFNLLVPENQMKFALLHPERDTYDFKDADAMVAFAKANDMQVRGHTLLWHLSVPRWLSEGNFTRDELMDILRDHIYTVVGHYRGSIVTWDVLNEAIDANGYIKDSIWQRVIGPEYIDLAFRWAHEADPQARLFYNDYGAERRGQKADALYNFVKGMLERGVPINGVGLQMHVGLTASPDPQEFADNLKRLAALGLDVDITEMDVLIQNSKIKGSLDKKFAEQGRLYGENFKVCVSAPNCKAFVIWGFTDKYNWAVSFTGRPDKPLILDESYRPKPAYNALLKLLSEK